VLLLHFQKFKSDEYVAVLLLHFQKKKKNRHWRVYLLLQQDADVDGCHPNPSRWQWRCLRSLADRDVSSFPRLLYIVFLVTGENEMAFPSSLSSSTGHGLPVVSNKAVAVVFLIFLMSCFAARTIDL
jgi:hypothetical protein